MIVPLAAAAVALFYLNAIPVHLALCLRLGTNGGFGAGVSVFEPRFALRQARRRQGKEMKPPAFLKDVDWPAAIEAGFRALQSLSGHIRVDRIRLFGYFGFGDAALTALVCGGLTALGTALRCASGRDVRLNLTPDFSGGPLRAELNGMISVRVGHIMLAALLGVYQYGTRRLKEWTSTPLKAS